MFCGPLNHGGYAETQQITFEGCNYAEHVALSLLKMQNMV